MGRVQAALLCARAWEPRRARVLFLGCTARRAASLLHASLAFPPTCSLALPTPHQHAATQPSTHFLVTTSRRLILPELVKRWGNHKLMNKWMTKFFYYLNRYYVDHHNQPTLAEAGTTAFRQQVYIPIRVRCAAAGRRGVARCGATIRRRSLSPSGGLFRSWLYLGAVYHLPCPPIHLRRAQADVTRELLALVRKEREGEPVERDVIRRCVEVYASMAPEGGGSLEAYEQDLQVPLLAETRQYYKAKADEWSSRDNVPTYLAKVGAQGREYEGVAEPWAVVGRCPGPVDVFRGCWVRG
jgi:hypothetical protein